MNNRHDPHIKSGGQRFRRALGLLAVSIGLLVCLAACNTTRDNRNVAVGNNAETRLQIVGQATWVPLEGGFWGILGKDGKRYDPGSLRQDFQREGQWVRVEAVPEAGRISFRMWGIPIRIVHIEPIRDTQEPGPEPEKAK